jgi:phospholipid/cholesterol/gamma-HCH transport system permease protein
MSTSHDNPITIIGRRSCSMLCYVGGLCILIQGVFFSVLHGFISKKHRLRWSATADQMVRVGVKSIGIVALVQGFIGVILVLQLAPVLSQYGQEAQVGTIIGIGGFRMLGPIFTAVVLSGFAGASIAAELGTMVVAEEIEALESMALNPLRYLVVPRVVATFLVMLLLTTFADLMIATGGYLIARFVLGPDVYREYWDVMQRTLSGKDYITGMIQGGLFGVLIGSIACFEGLRVRGGAEGVGKATTMTVVYSIVAIVVAACLCTVVFYVFDF